MDETLPPTPPPNPPQIIEFPLPSVERLASREFELFQEAANHCTIPIIADFRVNPNQIEMGSGFVIEIGNHLFVATARHCMSDNTFLAFHDFNIMRNRAQNTPTPVMRNIRHRTFDIGLLEIDKTLITPRRGVFQIIPCSIENLCVDLPQIPADNSNHEEHIYYMCGFPRAEDQRSADGKQTEPRVNFFGIIPEEIEPDVYKFIYATIAVQRRGLEFDEKQVGSPVGFSGGGVWKYHAPVSDELFSPRMAKVYAITSAWFEPKNKTKRQIWCIPIRHWIKLVFDNYPELQELLSRAFPLLNET